MKFCIQKGYDGRESSQVIRYCREHDIELIMSDTPVDGHIPLGTVEFVEMLIGQQVPDYYPEWASSLISRKLWRNDMGDVGEYFVKPADQYKRFEGHINYLTPIDLGFKGDVWVSEIVEFRDEWRLYVADGEVLCSWWYSGDDKTCEEFPNGFISVLDCPDDFCGAVDIGCINGSIHELVEVQHPYAIGWYGDYKDIEKYIDFLDKGFKFMKR